MKRLFLFCVLAIITDRVHSQQIPAFSQYYINPLMYNPAMTGNDEAANVFLFHRDQWKKMPMAPVSIALTIDAPLKNKKTGIGGSLYNNTLGYIENSGVNAFYSYKAVFSEKSSLNFGLSIGVMVNRIDFSKAIVKDPDDPFLLEGNQRKTALDANAGVVYFWKKTELGIAVPQLLENSFQYSINNSVSAYKLSRNYLISAKHTFYLDKENNVSVFPLIIARLAVNAPVQYEINAVINWKNAGWLGVSYKSNNAVAINARVKIQNSFSLGYSYGFTTGALKTFTGTSNEIAIGYAFNGTEKKEEEKIIKKQQEEITALSAKLEALEVQVLKNTSVPKSNDNAAEQLKKDIDQLNVKIDQLKKETTDASAALKTQILLLETKVSLLVKLIGN